MTYIKPYLTATLQGIRVDESRVESMVKENDRLMVQYNRMIELMIGEQGMALSRSAVKSKPKMFAGSNSQCAEYFHNLMNYQVMGKSKETGKPSLGKLSLYKLALKYENPVITLINIYRQTKKETGRLRFVPWIKTKDETNIQKVDNNSNSGQAITTTS